MNTTAIAILLPLLLGAVLGAEGHGQLASYEIGIALRTVKEYKLLVVSKVHNIK